MAASSVLPISPLEGQLNGLLRYFSENLTRTPDDTLAVVNRNLIELFNRDYHISVIANGDLCSSYPHDLILLEGQKEGPLSQNGHRVNNVAALRPLFYQSRHARVRDRFVMPVILVRNKNICRSSTLSNEVEVIMKNGLSMLYGSASEPTDEAAADAPPSSSLLEQQRQADIKLLKQLNIRYICDLMVENKKKKYGMYVCSSEKVDSLARYVNAELKLVSIPYPGVEFFKKFSDNLHQAQSLMFDWAHGDIDAELNVLEAPVLDLPWAEYRTWDLVNLTRNYLRLMVAYLSDTTTSNGVLVHCISGWDRTPLFVSLLRISLWADGEVHASLSASELLYLTIAYDWMLFSHQLADRSSRGEDIFHFCFYFLEHIDSLDYSIAGAPRCSCDGCTRSGDSGGATETVPLSTTPSPPAGIPIARRPARSESASEHEFQVGSWQMVHDTTTVSALSTPSPPLCAPLASHTGLPCSRLEKAARRRDRLLAVRDLFFANYVARTERSKTWWDWLGLGLQRQ